MKRDNELQIFNSPEFGQVRVLTIDGETWFVGKDVAEALGYGKGKSLNNAVANHVEEEDKGVIKLMTPGGMQDTIAINESGLYALIFRCRLESAKRFKRWVTSEVLPAIRRDGYYIMGEVLDDSDSKASRPLTTDDYLDAARIVAHCKNSRLPMVLGLLAQSGLKIDKVSDSKETLIGATTPESVLEYLSDMENCDIIDVPTSEVYSNYLAFCKNANYNPVDHRSFSRYVNEAFQTHSGLKRINGTPVRVYKIR